MVNIYKQLIAIRETDPGKELIKFLKQEVALQRSIVEKEETEPNMERIIRGKIICLKNLIRNFEEAEKLIHLNESAQKRRGKE
ncbi:MAG: hypothetical protein ACXABY_04055 [Candidatus Thorarchaeota archaeon]